jgi:hypothetical protein
MGKFSKSSTNGEFMKEECRAKISVYKRFVECNGFIKNGVCTKCKRIAKKD